MRRGIERAEALRAARRASARAASVTRLEMKRGLTGLATVASNASWLGLFGTLVGIHTSFGAVNGSKESILAYIFQGMSEAFAPCALGLLVALAAMWCYQYLLAEVEALELDMRNASLQLIDGLSHFGAG